jgi:hypothetical protein
MKIRARLKLNNWISVGMFIIMLAGLVALRIFPDIPGLGTDW